MPPGFQRPAHSRIVSAGASVYVPVRSRCCRRYYPQKGRQTWLRTNERWRSAEWFSVFCWRRSGARLIGQPVIAHVQRRGCSSERHPRGGHLQLRSRSILDQAATSSAVRSNGRVCYLGFTHRVERPRDLRANRFVSLGESRIGVAPPILAWYPAGDAHGYAFIYGSR